MKIKQVIVIRKDLKMRRGKEVSQGAHAAMMFLTKRLFMSDSAGPDSNWYEIMLSAAEQQWVKGNFRKITLQANSEQELQDIYDLAKIAGIEAHMVTDEGLTEFNGVPTKTAIAIGPDLDEKIDKITEGLKLY